MSTNYSLENNRYDTAIRDLKATLFDIVATEEAELSIIESKIANGIEQNEDLKKKCAEQNECLKRVLNITSELSTTLQKLDEYSRALKQLESGTVSEIVSSIDNGKINKAYNMDLKNGRKLVDETANDMITTINSSDEYSNEKDNLIENIRTIQDGPKEDVTNNEDNIVTYEDGNNAVSSIADSLNNLAMQNVFVPSGVVADNSIVEDEKNEENPVEEENNESTVENVTVENSEENTEESSNDNNTTNETPIEEDSSEVVLPNIDIVPEIPTEEVADVTEPVEVNTEVTVPVAENIEVPVTEAPSETVNTEVAIPVAETSEVPVTDASNEVVNTEVTIPVAENIEVPVTEAPSETVNTEVAIPVAETSEVPVTDASNEVVNTEVTIPVAETSEVPVADASNEVVNTEVAIPVAETSEVPVTDASNEVVNTEVTIPVAENIGVPVTEAPSEATVPVTEVDEVSNIVLPGNDLASNEPILPTIDVTDTNPVTSDPVTEMEQSLDNSMSLIKDNEQIIKENTDTNVIQKMIFIKRNANAARAILTTTSQITKLRNSRESQKALINLIDTTANNNLAANTLTAANNELENQQQIETSLINNGLLEPDTVDVQKQIESMLVEANDLYKSGKIEEAQAMYEQISTLNKQMQQNTTSAMSM